MVRDKKILFASCFCRQTRAIFAVGSLRLFPFWECQSIIFSQHSYPQTLFIIYHSTMTDLRKPTLIESIALGGASCVFTGTFSEETSPIFPHIFPRRHKEHWAAISRIFLSHYHYTLCCNSEFHASHWIGQDSHANFWEWTRHCRIHHFERRRYWLFLEGHRLGLGTRRFICFHQVGCLCSCPWRLGRFWQGW